jgi:hypothetical protein
LFLFFLAGLALALAFALDFVFIGVTLAGAYLTAAFAGLANAFLIFLVFSAFLISGFFAAFGVAFLLSLFSSLTAASFFGRDFFDFCYYFNCLLFSASSALFCYLSYLALSFYLCLSASLFCLSSSLSSCCLIFAASLAFLLAYAASLRLISLSCILSALFFLLAISLSIFFNLALCSFVNPYFLRTFSLSSKS